MTIQHTALPLDLSGEKAAITVSHDDTTPSCDGSFNTSYFAVNTSQSGGFDTSSPLLDLSSPLLYQSSSEAQAYRKELLRGSTIVFFCAGYSSKKFIYEVAAKHGVFTVIVDNHDSWAKSLVAEGVISAFVGVDMSTDPETCFSQALAGVVALGRKIDGVCTFVELSVSVAARLGQALGVPCNDPKLVDIARDKSRTRAVLKEAGLPNVLNTMIYSEADLEAAAALIGFPAVLKPVSGAASLGVQKVDCHDELLSVYRSVRETLSGLVVAAGALERKTSNPESGDSTGIDASAVIDVSILMEEYLDGVEVDVDVLMSGGECRYATVVDNGPTSEPYFGETWAALPSLLAVDMVDELKALAIASVVGIGFTDGVYHVELKYTSRGPRLIEVNARMGGGPTRMIHKLSFGIDLVLEQLFVAIGIPSRPVVPSVPLVHVAYSFINARKSGSVNSVEFMRKYAQLPNVVWVLTYVKAFEQVVGPEEGHPTWLGDVVVTHADGHAALKLAKQIENDIAIEFQSRSL